MNKKLLITIGIVAVIVGGFAFVVMRRAALEKQLGHPASFREFLGLGDKDAAAGTGGNGILGSLFNNPSTPGGGGGGTLSNVFQPLVSLFTSAPTTVNTNAPIDAGNPSNPWFNTPTQQTGTTNAPPVCSDVDLNIPFTAAEQDALDKLNDRFQTLYQKLYDDTNVSDEQATYDAVNLELKKVKELRQYCEKWAPDLTGKYAVRVPTPFWNDPVGVLKNGAYVMKDSRGFLSNGPQVTPGQVRTIQQYNINGLYADYGSVENNFKLNIW